MRERLTEAVALRENGDIGRATELLEDLRRDAPDDAEVIGELVRIRIQQGRIDEAGDLLLDALEAAGDSPPRALARAARRYYRAVAREALGDQTPFAPRDANAFREAAHYLALADDDGQNDWQLYYLQFAVGRLRALLGGPADTPVDVDELAARIATGGRLRTLAEFIDLIGEADVPAGEQAAALAAEFEAIRAAVARAEFDERFERRFTSEWRARLGQLGQYNAASDRVLLALPESVTVGAAPTPEQRASIVRRHAPRLLVALATHLRGVEPIDIDGDQLDELHTGAELVELGGTWRISAPVTALREAAWILERAIVARLPAEGSSRTQAP